MSDLRAAPSGHRNGLIADWKPYVWDKSGEQRRRQAEVDARLAEIRARITADLGDTAVCASCGTVYFVKDGHRCP